MVTSSVRADREASPTKLARNEKDQSVRVHENSFERTVETSPERQTWVIIAAGAVVPLGLAAAAVVTTYLAKQERTSTAAWVAVAVVGTSSVIATAAVSHRRSVSVDRTGDSEHAVDRNKRKDKAI